MARVRLVAVTAASALVVLLSGCSSDGTGKDGADQPASSTTADAGSGEKSDSSVPPGDAVTLAGTGKYAIGTEAPLGGYQLKGEPASQPEGCTWSIQDADGTIIAENQGSYAYLTDAKEYVTFVTDGCPDWEKFE